MAATAKRPRGRPPQPQAAETEARTLRLPAGYWRKARIIGAMRGTSMVGFVQMALDQAFAAASDLERAAGEKAAPRR